MEICCEHIFSFIRLLGYLCFLNLVTELKNDRTNKLAYEPNEDSDHPGQPSCLIIVFAVHSKESYGSTVKILNIGTCMSEQTV